MKYLLPISICFFSSYFLIAQSFTLVKELTPGLRNGEVSWGDLNNDGRLDFIQTGNTIEANSITRVYINKATGFTSFASGLPNIFEGRSDWGDYDNDGDQDLLLAGFTTGGLITRIYRNTNGQLAADNSVSLHGIDRGSVEWGDYDADGNLDILLSGQDANSNSITKIYKNSGGGVYSEVSATGITGISFGQAAWVDFDSDGDLDVMISGTTGMAPNTGPKVSKLYRNNGSAFSEVFPNAFVGLNYCSMDFGDYDHDGDMDLLMCGFTNSNMAFTAIYQNNEISFDIVFDGVLPAVLEGKVMWGDTDNDGDLDILISGNIISGNAKIAQVYNNTGAGFQPGQSFPEAGQSTAEFADYDNDGNLDIFISGQKNDLSLYTNIYKNDNMNNTPAGNANVLPSAPTNLTFKKENKKVHFGWNKSTDDNTAQQTLTYNIYLRSTADTVVVANSLSTGKRKVVKRGNVGHSNSLVLSGVNPGDYVWSVQAIDNSYAGSAFSLEVPIYVNFPPVITGLSAPLSTSAGTPLLISLSDLIVTDPDSSPADFSLTVYPGSNYSVENNVITPNAFGGDLVVQVSVSDLIDEGEKFPVIVTVPVIIGIDDAPKDSSLSIFPNPVDDQLNILTNGLAKPFQLQFYTPNGSEISHFPQEIGDGAHVFDLSQFGPGVYILQLKSGDSVRAMKIFKE